MNKVELINRVAEDAGIPRKDSEKVIATALEIIAETLKAGEKVQIVGFGIFEVKERAARIGRNPRTLEEVSIPATRVPLFKPAKALKDVISK